MDIWVMKPSFRRLIIRLIYSNQTICYMGQSFLNILIKEIILDTRTTEEVKTVDKVDYFCAIFTEFLRGKPTDHTAKWCLCIHGLARVVPHIAFQNPY